MEGLGLREKNFFFFFLIKENEHFEVSEKLAEMERQMQVFI